MALPFTLPDWVPPWVGFVILVLAVLFALCFLFMPFSVFGVKGRLEAIEARLDEIQGEIRSLVLRLPEPGRMEVEPIEPEMRRRWAEPNHRPPIPPRPAARTIPARPAGAAAKPPYRAWPPFRTALRPKLIRE